MFEESPPEPSTPARRLPAHAHRDCDAHSDGRKKSRHASIPASALHSAIQQTVSQQSSSATSTQDRGPSPSIFD
uniref:Uncharacterized protein n=1 Tax=Panagrolaimus davidi TaxID=227884 RepID=A0A914QAD9_9BILA